MHRGNYLCIYLNTSIHEVKKGSSNDEDDDDFQQFHFGGMSDDKQSGAGTTAWAVPSHSAALPRDVPPQKAGPVVVQSFYGLTRD